MLVVSWTDPFSAWICILSFGAAANKVASVSFNPLHVKGHGGHEYEYLKDEVSDNTKPSDETEVSQGWNVGEETNEEGNALTQGCGED